MVQLVNSKFAINFEFEFAGFFLTCGHLASNHSSKAQFCLLLTATSDLLSFVVAETRSFLFPANSDLSLTDSISYFTKIKADQHIASYG